MTADQDLLILRNSVVNRYACNSNLTSPGTRQFIPQIKSLQQRADTRSPHLRYRFCLDLARQRAPAHGNFIRVRDLNYPHRSSPRKAARSGIFAKTREHPAAINRSA
jgi:hypothetical protein